MGSLLLAIDTSTRWMHAALVGPEGETVGSSETTPEEGRPLAELVRDLVEGRWAAIGAYGIGVGPGSFTGLRVGLSFVKGLSAARPRPVVPVSSLAAWAQSIDAVPDRDALVGLDRWVVVDARRDQVWLGIYAPSGEGVDAKRPDQRLRIPDARTLLGSARPGCVVGTGLPFVFPGSVPPGWVTALDVPSPSAAHLGRLAHRAWVRGDATTARAVVPNYLMLSAAEEKQGPWVVD